MTKYRVENIEFTLDDLHSIRAKFDVERLDGTWTLVKTSEISIGIRSNAKEIAIEIGNAAMQIAIKDVLIIGVLEDARAILIGKEFEV